MREFHSPILKILTVYFLVVITLFYVVGCRYFELKHGTAEQLVTLQNIGEIHKTFIVHTGGMVYDLTDISIDSASIYGVLDIARGEVYYSDGRDDRYRTNEADILNEVHIYVKADVAELNLGRVEIPIADLDVIAIVEKDTGKTTASYVLSTAGVVLGAMVIATIIIALTKSSCPYVYVNDAEGYVFEGEVFGGAIAQNLERDDYMPLPSIRPVEGQYRIRISNELKERQFTDVAGLIVVNHPNDQQVLLDKRGVPQAIGNCVHPTSAITLKGTDMTSTLNDRDHDVFMFNEGHYASDGVILNFVKPSNAVEGKLILNGKNTLWFDYMFGEFLSKFGVSFDSWMEKQSMLSPEERMGNVLDKDFQLSVYIKKDKKWQLVDYIHTVGPLAGRDFVLPVDFSDIEDDEIEIKVETGFMFWELDFAAMSFDQNAGYQINYLMPASAVGTGSQDWTRALASSDGHYMVQKQVGEVTEIVYSVVPAFENEAQTVFLHSKGYYELIRDFSGLPQLDELNKFKDKDHFAYFSQTEYFKVTGSEGIDIVNMEPKGKNDRSEK